MEFTKLPDFIFWECPYLILWQHDNQKCQPHGGPAERVRISGSQSPSIVLAS